MIYICKRNIKQKKLVFSKHCTTFAALVPAKPLNNAQTGGAFFVISTMNSFTKPYVSPSNLVKLLKSRGLVINDDLRAESYLKNIGYYRLSAYMHPFLKWPKNYHRFKDNATFDKVLNLYRFDKKLRVLLFNEIEKIEIAFREAVANITAKLSGDIFWICEAQHFRNQAAYAKTFSLIDTEYKKSTEDFIKHFKNKYSNAYAPAWIIAEIIPFGTMIQLYKNLANQRIRKQISMEFFLQPQVLESWMTNLVLTRNACCHHSRIWNKVNLILPADIKHIIQPWITHPTSKDRIYFNICIVKFFLNIISPGNDFKTKLITLFDRFPAIDLKAMGFPSAWKTEPLWIHTENTTSSM